LAVRAEAAPLTAAAAGLPDPLAGADGEAAPLATVPAPAVPGDAAAWSVPVAPAASDGTAAAALPATGPAALSEAGDVWAALAAAACFPSLDRAPQADPIRSGSANAAIARRDPDIDFPLVVLIC
jgi:hypothetical protein